MDSIAEDTRALYCPIPNWRLLFPAGLRQADRMKNSKKTRRLADSTIAIHAGEGKFQKSEPVGTVIARTASFTFSSSEEMRLWAAGKSSAYMYTRYANPTLAVAEEKIARLEGGEAALVTASGMAAISSALFSVLKAGDEVIVTQALYGGSYRLMRNIFPRMGIVVRHVGTDLAGIERLVNPRTKALYIETPSIPRCAWSICAKPPRSPRNGI